MEGHVSNNRLEAPTTTMHAKRWAEKVLELLPFGNVPTMAARYPYEAKWVRVARESGWQVCLKVLKEMCRSVIQRKDRAAPAPFVGQYANWTSHHMRDMRGQLTELLAAYGEGGATGMSAMLLRHWTRERVCETLIGLRALANVEIDDHESLDPPIAKGGNSGGEYTNAIDRNIQTLRGKLDQANMIYPLRNASGKRLARAYF
jgi:hypothetical protein